MNKILVLGSGVFTLAAAGLMLVPNMAQAQSGNGNINGNGGGYGYQQSMASKAEVLGITSDQLTTEQYRILRLIDTTKANKSV